MFSKKKVSMFCVPHETMYVKFSINDAVCVMQKLWGGWAISGPNCKFYFAGDTAYNDEVFKLIGKKYGPFDLAAIPIGAYEPR